MTQAEYEEIMRRIHSRIYSHKRAIGSCGTHRANKERAEECLQIIKIIDTVMFEMKGESE